MATNTSLTTRLAEIENILRSGVRVSEVDGQRTEWDLDSLRKERSAILRKLNRRPVAAGIYMGGF